MTRLFTDPVDIDGIRDWVAENIDKYPPVLPGYDINRAVILMQVDIHTLRLGHRISPVWVPKYWWKARRYLINEFRRQWRLKYIDNGSME